MAVIYGRNTTTKQKRHYVVVRKKTKDSLCRSGTDGKVTRPTGSLSMSLIGQMLGWDTWTILQISTSPIQRRTCKGIDTTIYFTCGVSTKINKRHLYFNNQDTKTQRKHWLICASKYDKIAALFSSQKLQGNACEISSILQCEGILSGQALIGPIILQKNDLSRHLLLPGHQVHPGGPRPPGLRTGINSNGKTVRGLKSGEMRQHRLRSQ